jgi:hypothetical protein
VSTEITYVNGNLKKLSKHNVAQTSLKYINKQAKPLLIEKCRVFISYKTDSQPPLLLPPGPPIGFLKKDNPFHRYC